MCTTREWLERTLRDTRRGESLAMFAPATRPSARATAAGRSRCCTWTSTASRRSTTRTATRPATRLCARSRSGCCAPCAAATRCSGWAATGSSRSPTACPT
ncbi:MAG: hypothetical protein O9972_35715 [Burkholderiales bacterium]|nr:hypothetical protein [Burkholderiales bacterium]